MIGGLVSIARYVRRFGGGLPETLQALKAASESPDGVVVGAPPRDGGDGGGVVGLAVKDARDRGIGGGVLLSPAHGRGTVAEKVVAVDRVERENRRSRFEAVDVG